LQGFSDFSLFFEKKSQLLWRLSPKKFETLPGSTCCGIRIYYLVFDILARGAFLGFGLHFLRGVHPTSDRRSILLHERGKPLVHETPHKLLNFRDLVAARRARRAIAQLAPQIPQTRKQIEKRKREENLGIIIINSIAPLSSLVNNNWEKELLDFRLLV
jgi:hypothetical protein